MLARRLCLAIILLALFPASARAQMWTYWDFGVWDEGAQAYGLAHPAYGSLFMSLALDRDFSQVDFRQVAGANTVSIWLQDQGCLPPYTYYMADGYVFGTKELWYPPYYEEYEDYFWEGDWTPGPGVRVDSADIPSDNVTVTLWPCGGNGPLTVQFERDGGVTHQIFQGDREGGSHSFSFDIQNLPNGQEFTRVRATWQPNSVPPESDTLDYHFKVLGDYEHTQYNTPDHNVNCSGPVVPFTYINVQNCWAIGNCTTAPTGADVALDGWLRELDENGTGLHPTLGIFWREPSVGGCRSIAHQRRTCQTCPACLSLAPLLAGQDVAISTGSHPDLDCGDSVYVHELGVKTVKDRGGGVQTEQLDHYIGIAGCNVFNPGYGTKKTIKLYNN